MWFTSIILGAWSFVTLIPGGGVPQPSTKGGVLCSAELPVWSVLALATCIFLPGAPRKDYTPYQKRKMRQNFRRRVAIEPVIGHVKNDFRMDRNYLKGIIGDAINAFMSAAAFNFRKLLRNWGHFFIFLYFWHLKLSIINIGNRIRQPLQAKI